MINSIVTAVRACLVVLMLLVAIARTGSAADLVTGNGEWESRSGAAMRGTWSISLSQTGDSVRGTLSLTGSLLFSGAEVAGSIEGQEIVFGTVTDGENQLVFNGTLSDGSVTGEWSCATISDSGTWRGTLRNSLQP
jgi:hypothetical protein